MTAPFIDPELIRRQARGAGFVRGVVYYRERAVRKLEWDEEASVLSATVRGSRSARYQCRIRLNPDRLERPIVSTVCTCPMQEDCKHIVATLLTSNDAHDDGVNPALTDAAAPPALRPASPMPAQRAALAGPVRPVKPDVPAWRAVLAPPVYPNVRTARLALGVDLRQRAVRSAHGWTPRPAVSVTPRGLAQRQDGLLVGLRPLTPSLSTGAWIQSGASWDVVRRPGNSFVAAQAQWFAELYSIARDVMAIGAYADNSDWLTLDTIRSGLFWPHLRAARELDIPLVSMQKYLHLTLASNAAVAVEITPAAAGALKVATTVEIDGEPVATSSVRPVERTGLYSFTVSKDRIDLTLAAAPLSDPVHALLAAGASVDVPATDADEFLRTVTPRLVRTTDVRTSGGLDVPAPPAPELLLTVDFRPGDTVEFAFSWDYAGVGRFPVAETESSVNADRDLAAEREQWERARDIWRDAAESPFVTAGAQHGIEAAEFTTRVIPALQRRGIRVETTGKKPRYRELTAAPEITVSTVESTDSDWFDLGVIVKIDGRNIPFTPLFTALSQRRKKLLLADGRYFSLAHPSLDRLRELIEEAAELAEWETGPRISKYQTDLWADFEDLADEAIPAVTWRATAEGLRDVERIESTPLPGGVKAELRPYQKAGFDWLAFLWRHRLGGILADDMGLGKTLQMLSLIAHAREQGERRPFLVVTPTSVASAWASEAERFVPGLRMQSISATRTKRDASVATVSADADIIVTTYALLRLSQDEFSAVEWAGLVLDEAQFVKNAQTKLYRAARDVRADVTFAITGTPLENSLTDLWSLLSLTAPGLFASARRFREEYVGPIEKGKVPENQEGGDYRAKRLERLRRRIRPLVLRRTKELVAKDLPPKQEQHLHIELTPAHRLVYDTVLQRERQKILGLLEDLDRNRFIVFRSLTLLRMLSLMPGLVDPAHMSIGSSKLDALVEQLSEIVAEGHRTLVFSQFTSYLEHVAARLDREGIEHVYLDGSTRNRKQVIEAFRAGDAPVFLISLKAGGFGLTLTEADYVFLLDPWWNPAAEAQAVDRAHRIGQTRTVMVYRMIAAGTIEEKVMALQQRKARLFTAVMDDDALFGQALTSDDIRGLLEA